MNFGGRGARALGVGWFVLVAFLVWQWAGQPDDEGMRNVFTIFALGLGGTVTLAWFVTASGASAIARVATVLTLGVVVAALALTFRFEGFSGAMVPRFSFRFATPPLGAGSDPGEGDAVASSVAPDGAEEVVLDLPDFPGFLGPNRDAVVRDVALATDWDARSPELLWRRPIHAGWSAFAVAGGLAVTQEQRDEGEALVALDLATGEERWSFVTPGSFDHFLGGEGPRATPEIADGRVVALGARGTLTCVELVTGALVWQRDLLADFGVTPEMEAANVQYGRANSPLVMHRGGRGLVVVPAGGDASTRMAGLVALDLATGDVVWESAARQVSFASPTLVELAGRDQLLIVNEDDVTAHDPDSGETLWAWPWPGTTSANASVSQATAIAPSRVLLSKGYGVGAALLELATNGDRVEPREVWSNKRALRTKLTNPVVLDGHAYGLSDGILECVRVETGERVWKDGRYGHGQLLLVGALLLLVDEEGTVHLIEATPAAANRALASFDALRGKCWATPALAGDLLLLRNATEAAAYRLPLATGG